MYLEKDGVPLSAYEIRQEWFYNNGRGLLFVVGKERKPFRKADLPIRLEYFPASERSVSIPMNWINTALPPISRIMI